MTEAAVSRKGTTLYVSKLGDDSDGQSWRTAYRTVQAALDAIPDPLGGHTIVIRPDTYMEANLYPAHPGAAGAYNQLIGDVDGCLGSGTAGHVVLDSGDPGKGFKSYDWWGTLKSYKHEWSPEHTENTFSAIGWDRWHLSHLYATGGDGGFMFDCVDRVEPFSVVVEDCVSIGRAFGGGVASCLSRADEPILFRRCYLWALDWWGDTSAAYVRVENPAMPDRPDVYFEDCTMVGPQCALKASNYGFTTFSRVAVKGCRLIALNFSQPHGTPTDGIIQSVQHGRYLHVDLEATTLMGFKVFGSAVAKESAGEIQYTARSVQAYVQFTQEVPAGMHRLGHWPVDLFEHLVPPTPVRPVPRLDRERVIVRDMCELSPLIWQGRLCHLECVRPATGGTMADYYLLLRDADSGKELTRFATGYSLASAYVEDGVLYAFASRFAPDSWNDVTLFSSTDLKHWETSRVIEQEGEEHLFNTSVCRGPDGYVLAYETSDPKYPPFTVKFARSTDLRHWEKIPDAVFGTNRYAACPCLRWAGGYYYMLYLEHRDPRHYFETYITRSRDLRRWETSVANPVLRAQGTDEAINASDPELVEWEGRTWLYFAVGDQLTWMDIKRSAYPGRMQEFFEAWFTQPGIPDPGTAVGA
ncbi:MAG: hypothetical protein WDA75_03355 [Candidatus Latescibacterota bacterium]|jgi:hypothetical protein